MKQLSDTYDYIKLNNKKHSTYEGLNRIDNKDYDDLELFEENKTLSRKEIQKSLNIKQTRCVLLLKKLETTNKIVKIGHGRNIRYKQV